MSALIGVRNLTNFQEFSTACRKPVDNPAALGASHNMRKENGARKKLTGKDPAPSF
jgi:hypothetical protein